MPARASVPTLLGVPLQISVRPGGGVGIDGANLTLLDIPAENGIIHVVDGVLVPPGITLAPATPAAPTPTLSTSPLPTLPTRAGSDGSNGAVAGEALAVATMIGLRRR